MYTRVHMHLLQWNGAVDPGLWKRFRSGLTGGRKSGRWLTLMLCEGLRGWDVGDGWSPGVLRALGRLHVIHRASMVWRGIRLGWVVGGRVRYCMLSVLNGSLVLPSREPWNDSGVWIRCWR